LRFLINEFSVTSFIHGVFNLFVIDLLTGILSEFNYKLGINENTRGNQQSLRFFKGNYDEINRLLANTDWDLELAQGDIFLINEFSVTSFIHGVFNLFVIDLLTGILSLYVLDI
jgi:hypothetical protein